MDLCVCVCVWEQPRPSVSWMSHEGTEALTLRCIIFARCPCWCLAQVKASSDAPDLTLIKNLLMSWRCMKMQSVSLFFFYHNCPRTGVCPGVCTQASIAFFFPVVLCFADTRNPQQIKQDVSINLYPDALLLRTVLPPSQLLMSIDFSPVS